MTRHFKVSTTTEATSRSRSAGRKSKIKSIDVGNDDPQAEAFFNQLDAAFSEHPGYERVSKGRYREKSTQDSGISPHADGKSAVSKAAQTLLASIPGELEPDESRTRWGLQVHKFLIDDAIKDPDGEWLLLCEFADVVLKHEVQGQLVPLLVRDAVRWIKIFHKRRPANCRALLKKLMPIQRQISPSFSEMQIGEANELLRTGKTRHSHKKIEWDTRKGEYAADQAHLKKDSDFDIIFQPNADEFQNIPGAFRGTDVENLPPHAKKEDRVKALNAYLKVAQVPENEWAAFIEKVEIELARVMRPKWIGRLERGGELATLSAPLFLKHVHADQIEPDGTVRHDDIRAIDADLMRAVDLYIAQRKRRKLDLGDAKGLLFVASRPAPEGGSNSRRAAPNA